MLGFLTSNILNVFLFVRCFERASTRRLPCPWGSHAPTDDDRISAKLVGRSARNHEKMMTLDVFERRGRGVNDFP